MLDVGAREAELGEISSKFTVTQHGKPRFKFLKEQIQYQGHGARAEPWEVAGREVLTGTCFRDEGDPGLLSLMKQSMCGECGVHLGFESEKYTKSRSQPPEARSVSLMVCGHQACRETFRKEKVLPEIHDDGQGMTLSSAT